MRATGDKFYNTSVLLYFIHFPYEGMVSFFILFFKNHLHIKIVFKKKFYTCLICSRPHFCPGNEVWIYSKIIQKEIEVKDYNLPPGFFLSNGQDIEEDEQVIFSRRIHAPLETI